MLSVCNSVGKQLFLHLFNSFFQPQLICQALNSTLNTQHIWRLQAPTVKFAHWHLIQHGFDNSCKCISDVLSCFEAGKTAQITRKKQERQGATQTARHRGGKIKEDQAALKPTCQKRKQSHILCASRSFPFVLQENWCCLTRIGSNSVSLRKCQMIHLGQGFGLLIHSGILKMLHRLAATSMYQANHRGMDWKSNFSRLEKV